MPLVFQRKTNVHVKYYSVTESIQGICTFFICWKPVRIRVRIGPLHPLVCCKKWLNGAVLRMRPKKEDLFYSRCGTIKIPSCLKAVSAKQRPEFCSSSPAMVTSPYKWNILQRDAKSIIHCVQLSLLQGVVLQQSLLAALLFMKKEQFPQLVLYIYTTPVYTCKYY
jgi:hypothetical protein